MNNDNKKNIIIIILSLIIVLLIGFIVISNFIGDKSGNDVNNNENLNDNINESDVVLSNWMDYILSSDIQSITLIRNNEISLSEESRVSLTKEELKDIFANFKNNDLTKYKTTGIGVPVNELTISYKVNNNIYSFRILDNVMLIYEDNDLISLLDKIAVLEENEVNNLDSGYVFEFKNSYNGNIYDIYFQD